METGEGEGDSQFSTFIEVPAILDKYKAAAVVADGKNSIQKLKSTILTTSNVSMHDPLKRSVFYFVSFLHIHDSFLTFFHFSCPRKSNQPLC